MQRNPFNDLMLGKLQPLEAPEPPQPPQQSAMSTMCLSESESDDQLTLKEIIKTKPKTKVVREFFRDNLNCIIPEEIELFE